MPERTQSYASHRRTVPLFHLFAFPIIALNALASIYYLARHPSLGNAWIVVVSFALVAALWSIRTMATTAQDRVIRLEMQLRLARLLGPRAPDALSRLSVDQLIALRFASDEELPTLVDRCLAGELASKDAVKRAIQRWQPDWLRV